MSEFSNSWERGYAKDDIVFLYLIEIYTNIIFYRMDEKVNRIQKSLYNKEYIKKYKFSNLFMYLQNYVYYRLSWTRKLFCNDFEIIVRYIIFHPIQIHQPFIREVDYIKMEDRFFFAKSAEYSRNTYVNMNINNKIDLKNIGKLRYIDSLVQKTKCTVSNL